MVGTGKRVGAGPVATGWVAGPQAARMHRRVGRKRRIGCSRGRCCEYTYGRWIAA
jgi:hypothetical protein